MDYSVNNNILFIMFYTSLFFSLQVYIVCRRSKITVSYTGAIVCIADMLKTEVTIFNS